MNTSKINELLDFIAQSPTAFQAVDTISDRLLKAGYIDLSESKKWDLMPGNGYFLT